MTREEAIAVLRREIEPSVYEDEKSIAEAFDMAIEALQEVQKHEETFEWCHDCKEYDTDNHCCHRWSKVIRNTVGELKAYRPHGEWVEPQLIYTDAHKVTCTNCRERVVIVGETNFCPNCGAKMDKGGDDE